MAIRNPYYGCDHSPGGYCVMPSVPCGDTAEVLDLAEEALDKISVAIKPLAETGLPFALGFGRDVGHHALRLDPIADAVGIISLVGENDGARALFKRGADADGQKFLRVIAPGESVGEAYRCPAAEVQRLLFSKEAIPEVT